MKNHKTPRPESPEYNVEKPQELNKPAFNSSTDRRNSEELPAVEHMDDPQSRQKETKSDNTATAPKTNLGSGDRKKDEDDREKIIRR